MMIHVEIGRFRFYAVLGRRYDALLDEWQTSCLRIAWFGREALRVFRLGNKIKRTRVA